MTVVGNVFIQPCQDVTDLNSENLLTEKKHIHNQRNDLLRPVATIALETPSRLEGIHRLACPSIGWFRVTQSRVSECRPRRQSLQRVDQTPQLCSANTQNKLSKPIRFLLSQLSHRNQNQNLMNTCKNKCTCKIYRQIHISTYLTRQLHCLYAIVHASGSSCAQRCIQFINRSMVTDKIV